MTDPSTPAPAPVTAPAGTASAAPTAPTAPRRLARRRAGIVHGYARPDARRRAVAGLAARLFPGLAALWFERVFLTPTRPAAAETEAAPFASARAERLPYGAAGETLQVYSWGDGPAVLLLHGWSGYSAQFAAFVEPIVEAGFRAVAFDAPGHGRSGGKRTNMINNARALMKVADAFGPVHGVVAHSFGAPTALQAVRLGLGLKRMVFVAPSANLIEGTRHVAALMGFPPEVEARMRRRLEARIGITWDKLETDAALAGLAAAGRDAPLLVIHDERDREVPVANGRAVAEAGSDARLMTTRGLGHRRVLRDPAVIDAAIRFLADRGAAEEVEEGP